MVDFFISRVYKNADRLEKRAAKMRLHPKRYAVFLILLLFFNILKLVLLIMPKILKKVDKKITDYETGDLSMSYDKDKIRSSPIG